MDPVGVNVIETAALGRPFQLGMLYDCRKDALIPGLRLWTKDHLEQNICSRPHINTVFTVTASDSLKEKSKVLNINGGQKLSVFCGLIEVKGAARFLKDTKTSFSQQRLTLYYHSSTKFEELTINQLSSGDVLHYDDDVATHVVTAVLYGADACFVFDREVSSDEDKNTVAGEVQVALEKLKGISVGAKVDLDESQKTALQKFSCTFYGDFQLSSNPTTFEDAVKVFKDLPNLLGENNERVVPLKVWLYPLDKLFSRAVKFQHEISISLITDTESVIESLSTTEMKCSDLLTDAPALTFKAFQDKIKDMKQNCYEYKLRLMKELGSLLPKIRGKFIEDTALIDLLREHEESPFQRNALEQWLKEKEEESDVIKIILTKVKDSGATVEVTLNKIRMDMEDVNLVSYTFTSLCWSDELLSEQKIYLRPETKRKNDENTPVPKYKTWLTFDIQKIMRNNLKIFNTLIDSKDHESAKFIVSSKDMKEHPGSCILLYEDGCDDAVCFSPPSKPDRPITEEIRDGHVVLKVSPSCPSTVEMKLLYKMKKEKDWTSQAVLKNQRTVTLTDLRSDTEYDIKCAAVGKLNYTIESDVMTVITQGNMTSSDRLSKFIKKSILIEDGNPALYHLQTTTDNLNESESYRKITFGERDPEKTHKTLLIVGETGTGKTVLINTMINFICGVKREDKIWIEITDDQNNKSSVYSQTSIITVYGVYIPETSLDLTIIDTPGYEDTRDINSHQKISSDLLNLCRSEDGLRKIDVVCLVINASQTRLSVSQRYIFDAIQCLFGEDIEENIVLLFTYSTGSYPKNALTAVKEAQIKCAVDEENQPRYFLFNNCQSDTFDEEYKTIQNTSWDLSYRGMEGFFNFLDMIQPKTLIMTELVLKKRKLFEEMISKLQSCVQTIKLKQEELKQSQEVLKKHKNDVEEKKSFVYSVEVFYRVKVDINPEVAYKAMCCSVCKENCHYQGCWWICDLKGCSVMSNNHCIVCKCHYSKHVREHKIYVTKTKTEKRINEDLKNKYDDAIKYSQSEINKMNEELQELEKEKIKLLIDAFHYVDGLEIIALNTDSLFILQHIDFLIEMLEEIKEPEKVKALENIRKKSGKKHLLFY